MRTDAAVNGVGTLLLLLLLYDMDVCCHRPFLPGTSLGPAVIPTAQASSFTLQYFPYYHHFRIITIISFMQGIYSYIPEANYVPREYSVAAILLLLLWCLYR